MPKIHYVIAIVWMFAHHPHSYAENLMPKDGIKKWGFEEVIGSQGESPHQWK